MEIRVRPELEAAIRQDLEGGSNQTVDEYVEYAVSMLHEQAWLAAHRAEIESKIAEGYDAAQRGELLEPKEVRARLSQLKRAPRSEQR
jgi:predicted transcriptional regulator